MPASGSPPHAPHSRPGRTDVLVGAAGRDVPGRSWSGRSPPEEPRVIDTQNPATVTAASLAEEPPVTIGVDDPVDHVWQVMAGQRVWLLPVLDGRRLVGVIHYADFAATSGSAAPAPPGDLGERVAAAQLGTPGTGLLYLP